MTGRVERYGHFAISLLLIVGLAAFADRHLLSLHDPRTIAVVNSLAFGWMVVLLALAYSHRDVEPTPRKRRRLHGLRVTVVIPVFNEDPDAFRRTLDSLLAQTRLPDRVHVVDDGSSSDDCERVARTWMRQVPADLEVECTYQTNAGKRQAQARAFAMDETADVFMTLDSDTALDAKAVENGLKPFANRRVQSVGGMLLGSNHRDSLLARLVDLGFVLSYVNGRAAWSSVHSVIVNSGALAFYRADVVRAYLPEYLGQTVAGRPAASGDDRMMTNYALLEGWTVFQGSSFGYTAHPTSLRVLTKQRVRWWRSWFWGNLWLIRRFPPSRLVWWLVLWQLINFALYTVVVPAAFVILPLRHGAVPWAMFVYVILLGYARGTRFLLVRRPGESYWSRLATFALTPLASMLQMYLGWVLQYVGLATCTRNTWGTRGDSDPPSRDGPHAEPAVATLTGLAVLADIARDQSAAGIESRMAA